MRPTGRIEMIVNLQTSVKLKSAAGSFSESDDQEQIAKFLTSISHAWDVKVVVVPFTRN